MARFKYKQPHYLCLDCSARAKSKDGRPLKFSNIDMSGGSAGHDADTGESYPSHECYVDGIQCYADEHRFGGIVIQPVQKLFCVESQDLQSL